MMKINVPRLESTDSLKFSPRWRFWVRGSLIKEEPITEELLSVGFELENLYSTGDGFIHVIDGPPTIIKPPIFGNQFNEQWYNQVRCKRSRDPSHFIFYINVGKSRIRERTSLKFE